MAAWSETVKIIRRNAISNSCLSVTFYCAVINVVDVLPMWFTFPKSIVVHLILIKYSTLPCCLKAGRQS